MCRPQELFTRSPQWLQKLSLMKSPAPHLLQYRSGRSSGASTTRGTVPGLTPRFGMTSNRLCGGRRTFSRGGRISITPNTMSRIPNVGTMKASQFNPELTNTTSVKTVQEDPSNPRTSPQMVRMVAADSSKRHRPQRTPSRAA